MKLILSVIALSIFLQITLFAQGTLVINGKEVFSNNDVVFHQVDDHTWVGSGNKMWHESLYLLEGKDKALLIDAGTDIKDLDKIVASITKKPLMVVATHVHPDHTGSSINCFSEVFINPADTVLVPAMMPNYKGKLKYLKDREIINLGDRQIEVIYTPGHTPGSTTYIDKAAGYGFSGDSFGTGLLLLSVDFSTFIASCEKIIPIMDSYKLKYLYPGHFNDNKMETLSKISDMFKLSKDVLSGKIKGTINTESKFGLKLKVSGNGYDINYNESAIK
jgi:glyoxylase-like metal-dependent hydrolase (beta-lactamase superfamily II)